MDENILSVMEKVESLVKDNERLVKIQEEIEGRPYWVNARGDISPIYLPKPDSICVQTLQGIIDYLKMNPDKLKEDEVFIKVEGFAAVCIETSIRGEFEERFKMLTSICNSPLRNLNEYIGLEEFIIQLMSTFEQNEDRDNIADMLSKIIMEDETKINDNGITQRVATKKGVSLQEGKELPSIITLIPFRTFSEIEQPASDFLLRLKEDNGTVYAALFEADGGAWKNAAIQNIKTWLEATLKENGLSSFNVIA